jgi:hypothetical protein
MGGEGSGCDSAVECTQWTTKGDTSVRNLLRNSIYLLSSVVLTAGVAVSTALPAAAYAPGTATAYKPTYSVTAGGYNYHCSFAHWRSGAKVTWRCDLYEHHLGEGGWEWLLNTPHSGSWTPGPTSKTTTTWLRKLNPGQSQLCTWATALSVDGGTGTKIACN